MELIQEIETAFSNRVYPGDDNLLLRTDDEGEGKFFIRANWRNLNARDLESHTFALNCFTPDAFCYFLPAYLIACVENPSSGLTDSVLNRISPPKNNTTRPSFSEWWMKLSSTQKRIILEVFRFHNACGTILQPGVIDALEDACET